MSVTVEKRSLEGAKTDAPAGKPAGKWVGRTIEIIGIILTLSFILLPIIWIALTAFKNERDAFSSNLFFVPTLDNFITIFSDPLNFGPLLLNSVIIGTATIAIAIPVGLMAAYAFSRYNFVGNSVLLVWVLATQFIPSVVIVIPFYNLFRNLKLYDTHIALIVLNLSIVLPYAIWMIKGFVDTLPVEVEEAALVDGCNEPGILRHVTFPLVLPGVIVTSVFSFITAWNEFIFAFIMTRSNAKTLQVGLLNTSTVRGVQWELMSATGIIVMIPIFILSLLIRKYFVQGITMGAVK
jgi:multiple sugar transport system permease protein